MKLNVKLFRQSEGLCGPASARMVLNYYGFKMSERKIATAMKVNKKVGTDVPQILNGLKKLGFGARYKNNSSLLELKNLIAKDIPVIIYWNKNGEGHYSVFVGIDTKRVFVADPKNSKIIGLKNKNFLERWHDVDNLKDKRDIIVIEKTSKALVVQ